MRIIGILLAAAALTVPGCFFSRNKVHNPVAADKIGEIEIGKSTKADVVRLLGAPTDIIFSNRKHDPLRVFAYEYMYTVNKTTGLTLIVVTFVNSDTKRDHVLIFFDDKEIVSAVGRSLDADKASYKLPFGD